MRTNNYRRGQNVATGTSAALGVGKAAVGLGLIGKTTATGTALGGPVGAAAGLLAGVGATVFSALHGKSKRKDMEAQKNKEESAATATAIGNKKIADAMRDGARGGYSGDDVAGDSISLDSSNPIEPANPATPESTQANIAIDESADLAEIDSIVKGQEQSVLKSLNQSNANIEAGSKALDNATQDNSIASAMKWNANLNTASNLIGAATATAGIINSINSKPLEPLKAQVTKAPKEPSLVDDNTEAVRAMAESKIQGNLGSAEKQMLEMGVNPAMVQSIKTSQGNNASIDVNANLASNKHQIQATNAQIENQHEQFATSISAGNAQSINQVNQFNSQRQAMANGANAQALMQNIAALAGGMNNIGKGKLDKALMAKDLEMNKLQQDYMKSLIKRR